jgi:peptidoglycan/LPS O-acetylase OafA/YrhL
MAISHARRMNLVALALLLTALIAFVAFHFLVVEYDSDPMVEGKHQIGWEIWRSLFEFLKQADFSESRGMVAAASFLSATLLVVLTPFLLPVLKKSRLMWWVVFIPAGMATCGFGGIVAMNFFNAENSFGPGIPCLLAAFALNFIGLLFIRREVASDLMGDASH